MKLLKLLVILFVVTACSVASIHAANVTDIIHDFGQNADSGTSPEAALIDGGDGFLYGTTSKGGIEGAGTVYRIRPTGTDYEIVHHFQLSKLDGANPVAAVLLASNNMLYGTAKRGGRFGKGIVFRLNKNGSNYSIIHSFNGADGSTPLADVVESAGVLYGTTESRGPLSGGVVFKLNLDGSAFSILHSFSSAIGDGFNPHCGVIIGSDGMLYGTTYDGGGNNSHGTIYKLSKTGTGYVKLKSLLSNNIDGTYPEARLLQASDGLLYGTTTQGGSQGFGVLFRINKNGTGYTQISDFANYRETRGPKAALIESNDGFLYFPNEIAGSGGTITRIKKDGTELFVLIDFYPYNKGLYPSASLLEGPDGALYSVTRMGGTSLAGNIFKIDKSGANSRN